MVVAAVVKHSPQANGELRQIRHSRLVLHVLKLISRYKNKLQREIEPLFQVSMIRPVRIRRRKCVQFEVEDRSVDLSLPCNRCAIHRTSVLIRKFVLREREFTSTEEFEKLTSIKKKK